MELPKYIKEAIEKTAIYQMRATQNNKIVRDWLEKKGFSEMEEGGRDDGSVIDQLVDCLERECLPLEFIAYLEDNFE